MIKVNKKKGDFETFNPSKLLEAVKRSMKDAGQLDVEYAKEIVNKIQSEATEKVSWSELNEMVEQLLVHEGYKKSAKFFLLYRIYKNCSDKSGEYDFEIDPRDLSFPYNSLKVMEKRHLNRDSEGVVCETPVMLFRRVAKTVASIESAGRGKEFAGELEDKFFHLMLSRDFVPNTPALSNAGLPLGQLSACFVLPVEDSLRGIFRSARDAALIHKTGGGTGFSFSRIRPEGDIVKTTGGVASGPVSFMRIFDIATDVIKQGGRRRGANMGILRIDHPDIETFIDSKDVENKIFSNFNISVAVTDKFMKALELGDDYELINPANGKVVGTLNAKKIFEKITSHAWLTGDPGLFFIDKANQMNPVAHLAPIESTNPCGEQPLMPYESCNLGTINLGHMVAEKGSVDWNKLKYTVRLGTRFLDNVVDINKYPIPEIEEVSKKTRKIGLGMMGFADLLIQLGVRYDSEESIIMGERVANFVAFWSHYESVKLAREKGAFPAFNGSSYQEGIFPTELDGSVAKNIPELGVDWDALREKVKEGTRNSTNTTVAPNGLTGVVAGSVSSIEPAFALVFRRIGFEGVSLLESHPLFEKTLKERGLYNKEIMEQVAETGSIAHLNLPEDIKNTFRTAHDIAPEWHVRIQAAFQRYVDSGVSKTVNLDHNAVVDDVKETYKLAYQLGCKGVTVYRDQSKSQQVIQFGLKDRTKELAEEVVEIANMNVSPPVVEDVLDFKVKKPQVVVDSEFSGGCSHCDL